MQQAPFVDRYLAAARRLGHPLCVGLDPHLASLPARFAVDVRAPTSERSVLGVEAFLGEVIDVCAQRVAAVKPQIAFFEQLGWRGMKALEAVIARARNQGLLVVMDAKRGDIGSTAQAYARAFFGPGAPLEADALTLNPYMGFDTLEPFIDAAQAHGAGLFVLAKTSNPGSGDLEDQRIGERRVFEHIAARLFDLSQRLVGQSGWSSLGIVAGATYAEQGVALRRLLPRSLFLVPGYGAQGASARDAVQCFVPGPQGLEGGLVNSSRGVLFGKDDSQEGLRIRLDSAISELSQAVRQEAVRQGD